MDIQGHIIDHWVEKMLDHLAKLPDVRFLSSEEQGEPICDTSLP